MELMFDRIVAFFVTIMPVIVCSNVAMYITLSTDWPGYVSGVLIGLGAMATAQIAAYYARRDLF